MDREALVSRVLELKQEIETLEQEGRAFIALTHPSSFDRMLHNRRIVRLEEIQSELEQLANRHLQSVSCRPSALLKSSFGPV
jgi:hypothetical protein